MEQLQQAHAEAEQRAEELQQQLAASDEELGAARALLSNIQGEAAEARVLRARAAELEDRSSWLAREVRAGCTAPAG